MESTRLAAALLLPWIVGSAWMGALWDWSKPGSWAAVVGYGYVSGIVFTILLMLGFDAVGAGQHFFLIAAGLVLLGLPAAWMLLRTGATRSTPTNGPSERRKLAHWKTAAFLFIAVLILFRLGSIGLEILWRPLYPWDAWMNWAPKARVWFEHGMLVPFVSQHDWALGRTAGAYTGITHQNWDYPPLVPLVQLWITLALERWDESLINLPWFACAVALLLALFGQLRAFGAGALLGLTAAYMVLAMPLVSTHIALAGYAELWIAAIYALSAMAFLRWVEYRDIRQGLIALAFAAVLPLVKAPGFIWALTFVPALLVATIRARWLIPAALAAAAGFVALYLSSSIRFSVPVLGWVVLTPDEVRFAGYRSGGLGFHDVWEPFAQNLFVLGNWHLLWFLVAVFLITLPFTVRGRVTGSAATLALTGLGFLFLVFAFTRRYSQEAINYATINRALLHLVPALVFMMALTALQSARRRMDSAHEGESPRISAIQNQSATGEENRSATGRPQAAGHDGERRKPQEQSPPS